MFGLESAAEAGGGEANPEAPSADPASDSDAHAGSSATRAASDAATSAGGDRSSAEVAGASTPSPRDRDREDATTRAARRDDLEGAREGARGARAGGRVVQRIAIVVAARGGVVGGGQRAKEGGPILTTIDIHSRAGRHEVPRVPPAPVAENIDIIKFAAARTAPA